MVRRLFYHPPGFHEIDWHEKIPFYTGTGAAPAPLELIRKCRELDFPSMKDTE